MSSFEATIFEGGRALSQHSFLVRQLHTKLQTILRTGNVEIDGDSLDVPTVVAVSCHGVTPTLSESPAFIQRINDSVALLFRLIEEGNTIYGQQDRRMNRLV
ncbi:MAG: hypothetical protein Q9183_004564 [Haloplaca sp. 2 TL-2023]